MFNINLKRREKKELNSNKHRENSFYFKAFLTTVLNYILTMIKRVTFLLMENRNLGIHLQCHYAPDVDIYIKHFACVGIIVNYCKILKSVSYVRKPRGNSSY